MRLTLEDEAMIRAAWEAENGETTIHLDRTPPPSTGPNRAARREEAQQHRRDQRNLRTLKRLRERRQSEREARLRKPVKLLRGLQTARDYADRSLAEWELSQIDVQELRAIAGVDFATGRDRCVVVCSCNGFC